MYAYSWNDSHVARFWSVYPKRSAGLQHTSKFLPRSADAVGVDRDMVQYRYCHTDHGLLKYLP